MSKRPQTFTFFVLGQPMRTRRLDNKGQIRHPDKPVISVALKSDQMLVPQLVLTDIFGGSTQGVVHIGELIKGKIASKTTYSVEPLVSLNDPAITFVGDVAMDFSDPRRIRCLVPHGMRLAVNMQLVEMPNRPDNLRQFVIGDTWRGKPWLISISEIPHAAQIIPFPALCRA